MVAKAPSEPMTAEGVEVALRAHFASPRYAVITGVRNASGWDASRTCDLMALGVWQSTDHDLHGVEIKVARSDWLREIQDPTKADAFARYCDFWWIAAPPGIAKIEELPATWGLYEVVGRGLRVRRPATKNATPVVVDRELLACFARRVVEQSPSEALVKAAEKRGRDEARAEYEAREKKCDERDARREAEEEKHEARTLLKRFEELTGVHLGASNVEKMAESFGKWHKAHSEIGTTERYGTLLYALNEAKESAEKAIAVLTQGHPESPARAGGG